MISNGEGKEPSSSVVVVIGRYDLQGSGIHELLPFRMKPLVPDHLPFCFDVIVLFEAQFW